MSVLTQADLEEILAMLDHGPEYHHSGMGCGLEDRNIHNRYEAMQHGWDSAIERVYGEHVNPAIEAIKAAIEKVATPSPQDHAERRNTFVIPEGFEAVRGADGRATGEVRPITAPAPSTRVYPQELTDDLRAILSLMMWNTGPMAHALRDGGQDIKRKAEVEQAEVMHWLIGLALEHGSEWRTKASDRIREIQASVKAAASEGSTDA